MSKCAKTIGLITSAGTEYYFAIAQDRLQTDNHFPKTHTNQRNSCWQQIMAFRRCVQTFMAQ
jgi:hypothetical protein